MSPSKELLESLKTILLPGSLPLHHKPILQNIKLFSERERSFLLELRNLRETLPFKVGKSKKSRTTDVDAGEVDSLGSEKPKRKKSKVSSKKANLRCKESIGNNAKLKSLTEAEQAAMLKALGL